MLKKLVHGGLAKFGYALVKREYSPELWDMHGPEDEEFVRLSEQVAPFTLTSVERRFALYQACRYVMTAKIPGDFVECGVWRGGSSMLAALTFQKYQEAARSLYLFDTFSGMTAPTEADTDFAGKHALRSIAEEGLKGHSEMCLATRVDVEANLRSTQYPWENMHFIEGPVEETIPKTLPDRIAILRLDTDWYESTAHELKYLYPKLVVGGVLIIDDYGHWRGARKATDEYFAENGLTLLLNRIDNTGRIAIKTSGS